MIDRKWRIAVVVTLTAVVSAFSTLVLQAPRAAAQTTADCQIFRAGDDDYQGLASKAAALVAEGYVASGLAAQDHHLYTLLCRK